MRQKFDTHWVQVWDGDRFFLQGCVWDSETRPHPTPLPSLNMANLLDITPGCMPSMSIVVHANKSLLLSKVVSAYSSSWLRLILSRVVCALILLIFNSLVSPYDIILSSVLVSGSKSAMTTSNKLFFQGGRYGVIFKLVKFTMQIPPLSKGNFMANWGCRYYSPELVQAWASDQPTLQDVLASTSRYLTLISLLSHPKPIQVRRSKYPHVSTRSLKKPTIRWLCDTMRSLDIYIYFECLPVQHINQTSLINQHISNAIISKFDGYNH